MSIRPSPYFNSDQMRSAYSNLSSLFSPPSGADAAGWATANAKREEAARLAEFYALTQDPNTDWSAIDRQGVGVGHFNPSQTLERVDRDNATARYGHDRSFDASRMNNTDDNARAMATNQLDNQTRAVTSVFGPLNQGQVAPEIPPEFMEALGLPGVGPREGLPPAMSETEWNASQRQRLLDEGSLSDDDLVNAVVGERAPVQAVGPDGHPIFMNPGAAARENAPAYDRPTAERLDNYLAAGPNGEEIRFVGVVGPDGRVRDANTGEVVPNVMRKEGTGGNMSLEVDGEGGVRFSTGGSGNTVSQQTNLQGQRDAATQSARELQTLYDNLSASDVGVRGNLNQALTDFGAQIWPDVARGDVTAMRTQLQAATMRLARSLSGDSRISDTDRRMAQEIMAGTGLGESLPGARAKIAALTVLHAYRAKFAGSLASGGEPLPPINLSVLGQLVDDGAISPSLAEEYRHTMLSNTRGGPTVLPGSSPMPSSATTIQPGYVEGGYRFRGGDPADEANWEPVR